MNSKEKLLGVIKTPDLIENGWNSLVEKRREVPRAAVLEVTTGCSTGKCSHCYASAIVGKGEEIPPELALSILEGLSQAENRPNEVWITGGEPGIYSYLPTVAKSATELGFIVCIVTNGEPFANMALVKKVAPYVDSFAVTLRSFLPLQHQMMMGEIPPEVLRDAVRHWGEQPFDPPEEICRDLKKTGVSVSEFFIRDHHGRTIQALRNLKEYNGRGGERVNIELNHDVFNCWVGPEGHGELYRMLSGLKKEEGIVIDNVWLQVLAISGRAVESLRRQLPQICWLAPSAETILVYIQDQQKVKEEGLLRGKAVWIDPIPLPILQRLKAQGIESEKIPGYRPEATPAIDVRGNLRSDVLYPTS